MTRIFWILAMPFLMAAQVGTVDLSTPVLGYVFDSGSQRLRAIEGVPGAAILGEPITLEPALEGFSVAPNRRYAVARGSEGEGLWLIRLDNGVGTARRAGIPSGDVVFSPSGDALALRRGETVEIWTGMPDQPAMAASYAVPDGQLALSDDGGALVTLASGVLSRISSDGVEEIGSGFTSAGFLSRSQNLLAARGETVVTIAKAAAGGEETVMAEGVPAARRMALSRDQRTLLSWDGENTITLIDRETKSASRLTAPEGVIEGLWQSQGNAVFQLTQNASRDVWLIDADGESPRMVPVSKKEAQ